MVKVLSVPDGTVCARRGDRAVGAGRGVMVNVCVAAGLNEAWMVPFAVTLVSLYEVTAPTESR